MLDISLTYAQADEELDLAGLLSMKLARAGRADACIISRWEESAASLRRSARMAWRYPTRRMTCSVRPSLGKFSAMPVPKSSRPAAGTTPARCA